MSLERLRRLRLGARLQQLAEQHQRDDDGCRLEVQVLADPKNSTAAEKKYAALVPMATSTSMLAAPPRSAFHAPR
jgi:hypothetical protein